MVLEPIRILMAEDDLEDQLLVQKAFNESRVFNEIVFVRDGEELLDYLLGKHPYVGAPRPDILLLDLNMPRMDGREALMVLKRDESLRQIPVIVLTTSDADEDVLRSYNLGASSYIQKPVTFEKMVEVVNALGEYWIGFVRLPTSRH